MSDNHWCGCGRGALPHLEKDHNPLWHLPIHRLRNDQKPMCGQEHLVVGETLTPHMKDVTCKACLDACLTTGYKHRFVDGKCSVCEWPDPATEKVEYCSNCHHSVLGHFHAADGDTCAVIGCMCKTHITSGCRPQQIVNQMKCQRCGAWKISSVGSKEWHCPKPACRIADAGFIDMTTHVHDFDFQGLCVCGADRFPKGHKSVVEITDEDLKPTRPLDLGRYKIKFEKLEMSMTCTSCCTRVTNGVEHVCPKPRPDGKVEVVVKHQYSEACACATCRAFRQVADEDFMKHVNAVGHDFQESIDYLVKEYGLDRPNKTWAKGSVCHHIHRLVEAVKAHVPPLAYGVYRDPPFPGHDMSMPRDLHTYGESPISTQFKNAVKDRDAALFALRDLVRAVDDEIKAERISPEADDAEPDFRHALEVGRDLITLLCPGCKGRYTETDKHTCVREGS